MRAFFFFPSPENLHECLSTVFNGIESKLIPSRNTGVVLRGKGNLSCPAEPGAASRTRARLDGGNPPQSL